MDTSRNLPPPAGWLLETPAAWLQQLPEALDSDDALSLFQACRATRDLVLSEHHVRMGFPLPTANARAQAKSLQLACRLAKSVKLELRASIAEVAHQPSAHQLSADTNASACTLMFGTMAAAGQGLAAIKSVALGSLYLDALVPAWLTFTCPNMTSLQLRHFAFTVLPDATIASIPVCTQLKELTLSGALPDLTQPSQFASWQQQMRALPGLQSLTIDNGDPDGDDNNVDPRFLEACSAVGSQLTHLKFSCQAYPPRPPVPLATWFPSITELHLDGGWVRDEDMEVLLGMHNLRVLRCGDFRLEESYIARACAWTQLTLHAMDTGSFSLLPLGSVTSLKIDDQHDDNGGWATVYPSPDLEEAERAVAAIRRSGGMQWGSNDRVMLDNQHLADSECVAALMPMFATAAQLSRLQLSDVEEGSLQLLAAMRQHLPPTLHTITFSSCTFAADMWKQVIPGLPTQVHTLRIHLDEKRVNAEASIVTEEELIEVCVHANRPIRVKLINYEQELEVGWQERVQAAMAAAGHQHVSLRDGDEEENDEVGPEVGEGEHDD